MRLEKSGPRYFSFQELPGAKPKKNKKKNVTEEQQTDFAKKCRVCGTVLSYIEGTNVMVCGNPDCKGFKTKNEEKEEVETIPVFRTLDKRGVRTANVLFGGQNNG